MVVTRKAQHQDNSKPLSDLDWQAIDWVEKAAAVAGLETSVMGE